MLVILRIKTIFQECFYDRECLGSFHLRNRDWVFWFDVSVYNQKRLYKNWNVDFGNFIYLGIEITTNDGGEFRNY